LAKRGELPAVKKSAEPAFYMSKHVKAAVLGPPGACEKKKGNKEERGKSGKGTLSGSKKRVEAGREDIISPGPSSHLARSLHKGKLSGGGKAAS